MPLVYGKAQVSLLCVSRHTCGRTRPRTKYCKYIKKRGELDGIKELVDFATKLEQASVQTIENGVMTKDLASLSEVPEKKIVNTEDFLKEIRKTFEGMA